MQGHRQSVFILGFFFSYVKEREKGDRRNWPAVAEGKECGQFIGNSL